MSHRFPRDPYNRHRSNTRYGRQHREKRDAAARRHHPNNPCARCGNPLGPMGPDLHYDHDETGGYLGFSHAQCNIRAGAIKGNHQQQAVLPRSEWVGKTWRCANCGRGFHPMAATQRCCRAQCRHELALRLTARTPRERQLIDPRSCVVCGTAFAPKTSRSVACSDGCKRERLRQQTAAWKSEHPDQVIQHRRRWKAAQRRLEL